MTMRHTQTTDRKNFLLANDGVAVIEAAFVLPLLLAVLFGGIEFGMYFLKSNLNNNNMSAASRAVQNDPSDPSNRQLLTQTSLLSDESNVACAKSFVTFNAAENGDCVNGEWDTLAPANMPEGQSAYFVLIKSDVASASLSGLFDELLPNNKLQQVIKVNEQTNNGWVCNGESIEGKYCSIMLAQDRDTEGGTRDPSRTDLIMPPSCHPQGWSCGHYSLINKGNGMFASAAGESDEINVDFVPAKDTRDIRRGFWSR